MAESGGPYLLDVGVVALAHTETPVRERALRWVRDAVAGEIDAVVPYPAVFGAHTVLTTYYGHSNEDATRLLENFLDARRVHWYDRMPEEVVRDGLGRAARVNVDGWDGYYAAVALATGVETVVTLDDDFERVDGLAVEVVLDPAEFAELDEFLG
jgi:predicted nucleic acid-binding protein